MKFTGPGHPGMLACIAPPSFLMMGWWQHVQVIMLCFCRYMPVFMSDPLTCCTTAVGWSIACWLAAPWLILTQAAFCADADCE